MSAFLTINASLGRKLATTLLWFVRVCFFARRHDLWILGSHPHLSGPLQPAQDRQFGSSRSPWQAIARSLWHAPNREGKLEVEWLDGPPKGLDRSVQAFRYARERVSRVCAKDPWACLSPDRISGCCIVNLASFNEISKSKPITKRSVRNTVLFLFSGPHLCKLWTVTCPAELKCVGGCCSHKFEQWYLHVECLDSQPTSIHHLRPARLITACLKTRVR